MEGQTGPLALAATAMGGGGRKSLSCSCVENAAQRKERAWLGRGQPGPPTTRARACAPTPASVRFPEMRCWAQMHSHFYVRCIPLA